MSLLQSFLHGVCSNKYLKNNCFVRLHIRPSHTNLNISQNINGNALFVPSDVAKLVFISSPKRSIRPEKEDALGPLK